MNFFLSDEITVNRFTHKSATLNYLYNRDITLFPTYDSLILDTYEPENDFLEDNSQVQKFEENFNINWVKNTLEIKIKTNRWGNHQKEYVIYGLGTFGIQRTASKRRINGLTVELDIFLPENVSVVERDALFGWMDQGVKNQHKVVRSIKKKT